jgi:hypothetical protein
MPDGQPARTGDVAGTRLQLTGDDPQQRALAGAIRRHQPDAVAIGHHEVEIVEQLGSERQGKFVEADRAHIRRPGLCGASAPCRERPAWRRPERADLKGNRRGRPDPVRSALQHFLLQGEHRFSGGVAPDHWPSVMRCLDSTEIAPGHRLGNALGLQPK